MEKRVFDPFLTHFWSQNGPLSRHFGIFHGPKRAPTGSKWAKTTCLSITNGPRSLLEKCGFDPFLTHFMSQNGPFSRPFGIFRGPKHATTGSKRPKNTCLSIPSGLGTTLEKMIFFAPGTLVDPPLALAGRGPGCPPAAPSDHRYGGLGVSLGDSEAWKPQKVGGCGWTRCPRNWDLSHVVQDTARAWFRGVGAYCAVFGAFWRLFGPFLGHIVELKGTRGLFDTLKSSRTCNPPPRSGEKNPMFRRNVPASRFFSKRGSRCPGSQSQGANTPSFWLFGSWSNVETQSIPQFAKKIFHLSVCIWLLVSIMSEPATGPVDMHWSTDLQA